MECDLDVFTYNNVMEVLVMYNLGDDSNSVGSNNGDDDIDADMNGFPL